MKLLFVMVSSMCVVSAAIAKEMESGMQDGVYQKQYKESKVPRVQGQFKDGHSVGKWTIQSFDQKTKLEVTYSEKKAYFNLPSEGTIEKGNITGNVSRILGMMKVPQGASLSGASYFPSLIKPVLLYDTSLKQNVIALAVRENLFTYDKVLERKCENSVDQGESYLWYVYEKNNNMCLIKMNGHPMFPTCKSIEELYWTECNEFKNAVDYCKSNYLSVDYDEVFYQAPNGPVKKFKSLSDRKDSLHVGWLASKMVKGELWVHIKFSEYFGEEKLKYDGDAWIKFWKDNFPRMHCSGMN